MLEINRLAPQFELPSFSNGEFGKLSLESLRSKWVYMCFYPGDFTFV